MFAIICRGFVIKEREEIYLKSWPIIAHYFKENCGALGSALHKTDEGEYITYSRWPSKEARDRYWTEQEAHMPEPVKEAITLLKSCFDAHKPFLEIPIHVIKDFMFE